MSAGSEPLAVKITYSHHSFIEMAFSTDSQEPSHTTLTVLLFDMKISLVLLNEFIYLSGPIKKFCISLYNFPRGWLEVRGFDYIKLCYYKQIVTDFNGSVF